MDGRPYLSMYTNTSAKESVPMLGKVGSTFDWAQKSVAPVPRLAPLSPRLKSPHFPSTTASALYAGLKRKIRNAPKAASANPTKSRGLGAVLGGC